MRRLVWASLFSAAISAAATSAALPAGSEDCSCENVAALRQELRNAITLKQRYTDKRAALENKYGSDPKGGELIQAELEAESFSKGDGPGTALDGITRPADGGSADIKYIPRGQALQEAHDRDSRNGIPFAKKWVNDIEVPDLEMRKKIEAEWRAKGQDLCDHQTEGEIEKAASDGAVCKGVADIIINHERAHQNTCRKMGYYAFADRKPLARYDDEIAAYDQQIKGLSAELQKVLASKKTRITNKPLAPGVEGLLAAKAECLIAVQVSGRIDDLKLSGTICDTAEEAKLKGNLPINFVMKPTDKMTGSYSYRGRAVGTDFWGSGNYQYDLSVGAGTLTLDGSGGWWAKNPAGTASKPGPEKLKATELPNGCK